MTSWAPLFPVAAGIVISVVALFTASVAADVGNAGAWGDQGDGTFKNPILPGDFSDPDVIRVGGDYYLITSTFQYAPGMAVMRSKDLVNWQFIGHCVDDLTQIGPELNWDRMNRYNRGIYAGAIRFHAGKFWVFFTTMDEGLFMTTASDPAGPWTPLHRIWDGRGWDDPCPFWDDDGQAYLLLSKPGKEWWTHLFKMTSDGMTIDLSSDVILDAHHGSEGNKMYKIDGTYFIFHNEIRGERVGVMMRAKRLAGPWEEKLVLKGAAGKGEREPNQGGLVQSEKGDWWFITQQGRGDYDGRPSHLLPVRWIDGWPVPGQIVPTSGAGAITWTHRKPIDGFPIQAPQSDDDFESKAMGPQWEWNYQPRREKWSLKERPGFLRLRAFQPLRKGDLLKAGNTLTQRLMGAGGGEVRVKLDVSGMADGQYAGLCHFSDTFAMLGVRQAAGVRSIVYRDRQKAAGKLDPQGTIDGQRLSAADVWLGSIIDDAGLARAQYSLDGTTFTAIGEPYRMRWANYRGDRIGIFCFNDEAEAGFVDVDWFHYSFAGPTIAKKN